MEETVEFYVVASKHWIVTGGTANVTLDAEVKMIHENESVFIPMSTRHRLENVVRMHLEFIGNPNDKYLQEDDIVRFDVVYGKA